jgi:hypothetical protein
MSRVCRTRGVRSLIRAVLAGTALMLFVAGCGAPSLPSWLVRHYPWAAAGVSTLKPQDGAVWITPEEMAVVTWGSSGCPDLPTRMTVPASNRLTVTAEPYDPSNSSCPADLAPTTSVIKVPAALSLTDDVTVTIVDVSYGATVSLPPRDGGGYVPALRSREGQLAHPRRRAGDETRSDASQHSL